MTLTEQWKKGELKDGYYYAEDGGEELIIHIQGKNGSVMGDDFNIEATDWIKPIAPVPSYDDWVYLHKARNDAREKVESLTQENQQLKELLKEAKDIIEWYKADCGYKDLPTESVLTKIDNAIGEKK